MQLKLASSLLLATLLALLAPSTLHADGLLTMRGAYYKERSTRVVQPMLNADLDVGTDGQLLAHGLVDAITSASAASGAVGDPFTERRSEAGALYMHSLGRYRLGGGLRYSSEPDYQSTFGSLRLEADFAQRNTTVGLNIARGRDHIDNSGSQGGLSSILTGTLDTSMVSASLTQLLSPVSVVSFSYDLMYLEGFQENIYRTVPAGGMIQPERVPDRRLRQAMASTLRYYVESTNTAVIASYRYYLDDWGIRAHAPEMRTVQELLEGDVELHLNYRYYRQRRADFYEEVYDSGDMEIEPYLTADSKLGDVRTHNAGFKLACRLRRFGVGGSWGDVRVEGLFQYLKQNTHYGDAVISQLAMTFPIDY